LVDTHADRAGADDDVTEVLDLGISFEHHPHLPAREVLHHQLHHHGQILIDLLLARERLHFWRERECDRARLAHRYSPWIPCSLSRRPAHDKALLAFTARRAFASRPPRRRHCIRSKSSFSASVRSFFIARAFSCRTRSLVMPNCSPISSSVMPLA